MGEVRQQLENQIGQLQVAKVKVKGVTCLLCGVNGTHNES